MFKFLIGLINPVAGIVDKIAAAKFEAARAQTDETRIHAEERTRALEARRDVLIAESGRPWNAIMRGMIAAPVAVLLWKVLVYDKAFGQWTGGRTDALDPNLWWVVSTVIGFYFIAETVQAWRR